MFDVLCRRILAATASRAGRLLPVIVVAVSQSPTHSMSKGNQGSIHLVAGLGVKGDAHAGRRVKHRSRVKADPSQPNLRQVHLIHQELHEELAARGFEVAAGQMGENITTRGVDLLGLPRAARLGLGAQAVVEITGLRNPCSQLDGLEPGLTAATTDRAPDGGVIRKAGVMGIVLTSGDVRPGDPIRIELPEGPHRALECV